MAKNIVQKAEEEILKGRTHQDVFNEIAYHTDHGIHEIADNIRKIVTPAKRKKYGVLNFTLVLLVIAVFSINIWSLFRLGVEIFPLIAVAACVFLVYVCLKFRPDAHLITGGFLSITLVRNIFFFNSGSATLFVIFLVAAIAGASIAFFLAWKLPADYRMDKELLKKNPDQREGSLIFTD